MCTGTDEPVMQWLRRLAEAFAVELTPDRPSVVTASRTPLGVTMTVVWHPGTLARLLGRAPRTQRLVGTPYGFGAVCTAHRWWARDSAERLPDWRWEELDALADQHVRHAL